MARTLPIAFSHNPLILIVTDILRGNVCWLSQHGSATIIVSDVLSYFLLAMSRNGTQVSLYFYLITVTAYQVKVGSSFIINIIP